MATFWSMQLHPNQIWDFPADRIRHILAERRVIGVGGDNGDAQRFQSNAKVGDIVLIRRGGSLVALVEISSDAYKNPKQDQDCWFDVVRDVNVIADNPEQYYAEYKMMYGQEPTAGLRVRGTFSRIGALNVMNFVQFWLKKTKGGKMMFEMIDLLERAKQIVLTGAPGTGKTFLAIQLARLLILGRVVKDEKELSDEEKKVLNEQMGFCQFHPSMDYTDFVEGLRPIEMDDETGQIGFELKDGIFKEFCRRALKGRIGTGTIGGRVDNFDDAWTRLISEHINEAEGEILSIPMGGGRHLDLEVNKFGTGLANRKYDESGRPVKGQAKFFSREQLYRVYTGKRGVPSGAHDGYRKHILRFMEKECGLQAFEEGDSSAKPRPYVFIIDEINRGDIAKIFGELFFAIDPGYRGKDGQIQTQYHNLIDDDDVFKKFFVPDNVYIIGTMNDIDRGVESMDFAIRRRFIWHEITPADTQEAILESAITDASIREQAQNRLGHLNVAIKQDPELGAAFQIGAAYFTQLEGEKFDELWRYRICPLLHEYMRGQEKVSERLEKYKEEFNREEPLSEADKKTLAF